MLKMICFAIFTVAVINGSSIWEQFKEYRRSENEHEIKCLTVSASAEMVKTVLKDYAQENHLIDVKTDTIHIQINQN